MRKKELSDVQAARVLRRLRQLVEREGGQRAAARVLHISQPALSELLHEVTSPSLATANALADVLGVPVESVLRSPRDRAAALCREVGLPDEAVRRVLAEPGDDDEHRPVLWYVDRMRMTAQTLEK